MLITRGAGLRRSSGSAARVQRIWARSLTSMSACQSSSVSVAKVPGRAPPALLTRMSMPPIAVAAASMNALTWPGSVTSQGSAVTFPSLPPDRPAAAVISSSACREQIVTLAPSASSSAAMARPSPLEPPVTTARRPAPGPSGFGRRGAGRAVLRSGARVLGLRQCEQRGARRAEDVDLPAARGGGPGAVRYPGRDHRDVALAHHPDVTVQVEGELAVEHDHDLLFLVDVPGRLGARLEVHEVGHRALAEHRPEPEPGDELGRLDVVHADVTAGPGRLPECLGSEMRPGVAHDPSRASLMTPASLAMPSPIRSSATRL